MWVVTCTLVTLQNGEGRESSVCTMRMLSPAGLSRNDDATIRTGMPCGCLSFGWLMQGLSVEQNSRNIIARLTAFQVWIHNSERFVPLKYDYVMFKLLWSLHWIMDFFFAMGVLSLIILDNNNLFLQRLLWCVVKHSLLFQLPSRGLLCRRLTRANATQLRSCPKPRWEMESQPLL